MQSVFGVKKTPTALQSNKIWSNGHSDIEYDFIEQWQWQYAIEIMTE